MYPLLNIKPEIFNIVKNAFKPPRYRSHSPHSPRGRHSSNKGTFQNDVTDAAKPIKNLDHNVKQVSQAHTYKTNESQMSSFFSSISLGSKCFALF